MQDNKFETTPNPTIRISKAASSLQIRGWDRPQIRINSDEADAVSVEISDDEFDFKINTGAVIRVPVESDIEIVHASSDLVVKGVYGKLFIEKAASSATFKSIETLELLKVMGNLVVKDVEGSLTVEEVRGNATIREISGKINLDEVIGNINLRGYISSAEMEAAGNINAIVNVDKDGTYNLAAAGNCIFRTDTDFDGDVVMLSGAERINVRTANKRETINQNEYKIEGVGSGLIRLEAGGNTDYSCRYTSDFEMQFEEDFVSSATNLVEDITSQVTGQIDAQIEALTERINSLSIGPADDLSGTSRIAVDKAERKLQQAKRKLERQKAKTRQRAEKAARRKAHRSHRRTGYRAAPVSDPVSDEERKIVLQMVADQTIDIDQAEMLLAALEGNQTRKSGVRAVPAIPAVPAVPAILAKPAKPAKPVDPIKVDLPDLKALAEMDMLDDLDVLNELDDIDDAVDTE